jgi:sperm-associated antigen 1
VKDENLMCLEPGALEAFDSIKPPVRTVGRVKDTQKVSAKSKSGTHDDYAKWDKYDPDTEILRMELEEEKNRGKGQDATPIIQEITETDVCRLTKLEKKELAQQHKFKGNDFFRAGDFAAALEEYSASLKLDETVFCLNNRALVYFKMGKYKKTVADCDRSLRLEPKNSKALFRKAEALLALDQQSSEAFEIYQQLLVGEPTNKAILKRLEELRKTRPEPKPHRMK